MRFEDSGKVGLMSKPGCKADLNKRRIGPGKLTTGKVDSEVANVFAWRTSEMFAKDSGQMNRMNVNCFGDAGETDAVVEICFKNVSRAYQANEVVWGLRGYSVGAIGRQQAQALIPRLRVASPRP